MEAYSYRGRRRSGRERRVRDGYWFRRRSILVPLRFRAHMTESRIRSEFGATATKFSHCYQSIAIHAFFNRRVISTLTTLAVSRECENPATPTSCARNIHLTERPLCRLYVPHRHLPQTETTVSSGRFRPRRHRERERSQPSPQRHRYQPVELVPLRHALRFGRRAGIPTSNSRPPRIPDASICCTISAETAASGWVQVRHLPFSKHYRCIATQMRYRIHLKHFLRSYLPQTDAAGTLAW
jgi:hypothetical protein